MHYRKIGGIHWFFIGQWRVSIFKVRPKAYKMLPIAKWEPPLKPTLRTWVNDEHNHFIF